MTQVRHIAAIGLTFGVAYQAFLAGIEELFAPGVIEVGGDALSRAEGGPCPRAQPVSPRMPSRTRRILSSAENFGTVNNRQSPADGANGVCNGRLLLRHSGLPWGYTMARSAAISEAISVRFQLTTYSLVSRQIVGGHVSESTR